MRTDLALTLLCLVGLGCSSREAFHARNRRHVPSRPVRSEDAHLAARNESGYRYLNSKTKKYMVESLPDVPYDVGELYSGLIPISYSNTSDALFFIFQPTIGDPVDEVTIYLNGGPGWSSFEGFFQENGRFLWQPGTFAPVENPYTWVNLTNMMWVDQPIGTGFSTGTPTATNEVESAQQFIKFFKNFEKIFGIKNYKIYMTGESYAGRYVPYISAAMLDQKDKEYYDLSGAIVYDPCIGNWDFVQQEIPVYPFAQANLNVMGFNSTLMSKAASLFESCGYSDWIEKYLVYPAAGNQPAVLFNSSSPKNASCDLWTLFDDAAFAINPCFNVYDVSNACPLLWDVLGHQTQFNYVPQGATVYPNRTDVQNAMHAPHISWVLDQNTEPVFIAGGGDGGPELSGDTSPDPIQGVLPQVIEATNRVLIANGDLDMVIQTNGTLLSIQNMTWNGKLGFQSKPSQYMVVEIPDLQYAPYIAATGYLEGTDGPQGVVGIKHYERGLMWAQTFLSAHTQPASQPRATYKHLQWLLGRIDDL